MHLWCAVMWPRRSFLMKTGQEEKLFLWLSSWQAYQEMKPYRKGKAFWDTCGKSQEAQLLLSTPSLRSIGQVLFIAVGFFKRQQNEHPLLVPQARQRWEQQCLSLIPDGIKSSLGYTEVSMPCIARSQEGFYFCKSS